jgi:hypothetical protein
MGTVYQDSHAEVMARRFLDESRSHRGATFDNESLRELCHRENSNIRTMLNMVFMFVGQEEGANKIPTGLGMLCPVCVWR